MAPPGNQAANGENKLQPIVSGETGLLDSRMEKGLREKFSLDQLEKEYIRKVLIGVGGNKSRAAEILGFDRKTLYQKLEEI